MNSGVGSIADTANRAVVVIEREVALGRDKDTDTASRIQDDLNLGCAMLVLDDSQDSTLTSRNRRKERSGSRKANRVVSMRKRCEKWGRYGYGGHDY